MRLAVRWTIGDVSPRGWESLRLSVYSALRLFGREPRYVICVNSLPLSEAKRRAGTLPVEVLWHEQTVAEIPSWLRAHLGAAMTEGTGWKLTPLQLFPDRHELSLDNDLVLWEQPAAMREWLRRSDATLMAEDVERCFGRFQSSPVAGALNSGIRGLPPGFSYEAKLQAAMLDLEQLSGAPVQLTSELDEQGLQAAALSRDTPLLRVTTAEVSICSPFWPRNPELGSCGAHFVGLNPKMIPWNYFDRPGYEVRAEHWDRYRAEIYARAGLSKELPSL